LRLENNRTTKGATMITVINERIRYWKNLGQKFLGKRLRLSLTVAIAMVGPFDIMP
jgi:hypothetical protein